MIQILTKEFSKTKIELCSCSNSFSLNKTLEQLELELAHRQPPDLEAMLITEISACQTAQVRHLGRIEEARVHKLVVEWSILRREEQHQQRVANRPKEANLNLEGDN